MAKSTTIIQQAGGKNQIATVVRLIVKQTTENRHKLKHQNNPFQVF